MKLSTARKLVCMSYFMAGGIPAVLATASRVVHVGDTKRFMFPDGSVLESVKGHWKVMKNPKLEAAVKRFGGFAEGGYVKDPRLPGEIAGVVRDGSPFPKAPIGEKVNTLDWDIEFPSWEVGKPFVSDRTIRLRMEVLKLQELLNEKDEQLDKASRPMVVRLDWWLVGLVGLVLVAHGLGYMR